MQEVEIKKGDFFAITERAGYDSSWIDDILEALAVSGDFVAVKNHTADFIFPVNIKKVKTQILSKDFAKVMTDFYSETRQQPQ